MPTVAALSTAPSEEKKNAENRAQRQARFDQVKDLQKQGVNILQAAKQLKMSRVTIRGIFHADEFPARSRHRRHKSILDPYLSLERAGRTHN